MRVVINLSCSFDPIIALLFFMVIAASNILSINIHQTFHTHAHTHKHRIGCRFVNYVFFLFFFSCFILNKSIAIDYSHPPLPPPLYCTVSQHWWHLGGIMGKCHRSRITVYLLSSLRLTSPCIFSNSYLKETQCNHTLPVSSLNAILLDKAQIWQ